MATTSARRAATPRPRQVTVEIPVPAVLDPSAVERALRAQVEDLALVAGIRDAVRAATTPILPSLLAAVAVQERRWRDIEERYGLLDGAAVARLAGSTARNRSEYASNLRARGQIVGARRRGGYVYPGFQFTAAGTVYPVVADILGVMTAQDWDSESIILWMAAPNGYLGGGAPADRLDDRRAVLDAAISAARAAE